jgi:hypothetical protein
MEKHFEIKITFEQDGKNVAVIGVKSQPGKIGATDFEVSLSRKDDCLATKMAFTFFNLVSARIKKAIRENKQPAARA